MLSLGFMGVTSTITKRFVGAYDQGSVSAGARHRRWQWLAREFPEIGEMKVLDVGGDARSWIIGGVQPAHVTLMNLGEPEAPESWMTSLSADACDPPDSIGEFDLVFSNSVIEHVGGHWRRERYAELVRGAAPKYWVQTPYRYFPIEPHYLAPWLQHLPLRLQSKILAKWPVGNYSELSDSVLGLELVQEIELQSRSQMKYYFPDAELEYERMGPFVKSLVAIRH